MALPALAVLAPAVASAAAGYFSQKDTNKTNYDIAMQTNDANADMAAKTSQFNAQQAELNRQFQAKQSASAYQTAVADMRKAGLNPALAYQQGGASAMSGNTASGVTSTAQAPRMERNTGLENLTAGVSSAMQARMAEKQFDQTALMNQEAVRTQQTQQASNIASAKQSAASAEKITQDKQNSIAQLALATGDQKLKKTALEQTLINQKEQARLTNLQGHTVSAKLGGIQAESDWQKAESGYKSKNAEWLVPLNTATDSVGRIMDGISSGLNIFDKFMPSKQTTRSTSYSPKTGEIYHDKTTTSSRSRRGK